MLRNFHTSERRAVPAGALLAEEHRRPVLEADGGAAVASTTGELSTIPSVASERSSAALRSGVRPAAGRVTGVDGAGAGWGTEAMTAASARGDGRARDARGHGLVDQRDHPVEVGGR